MSVHVPCSSVLLCMSASRSWKRNPRELYSKPNCTCEGFCLNFTLSSHLHADLFTLQHKKKVGKRNHQGQSHSQHATLLFPLFTASACTHTTPQQLAHNHVKMPEQL
jgi:hypothetical protein